MKYEMELPVDMMHRLDLLFSGNDPSTVWGNSYSNVRGDPESYLTRKARMLDDGELRAPEFYEACIRGLLFPMDLMNEHRQSELALYVAYCFARRREAMMAQDETEGVEEAPAEE